MTKTPRGLLPRLKQQLNVSIEFTTNMSSAVEGECFIRNDISIMITTAKDNYFASLGRKLSNPNISIKKYWSTLNRIINKKNMSNIPPLIQNSIFVTIFLTITLYNSVPSI